MIYFKVPEIQIQMEMETRNLFTKRIMVCGWYIQGAQHWKYNFIYPLWVSSVKGRTENDDWLFSTFLLNWNYVGSRSGIKYRRLKEQKDGGGMEGVQQGLEKIFWLSSTLFEEGSRAEK